MPINKKIAEKNKKWNTNAGDDYVSNGPFKMTAWKHSGSITLEKMTSIGIKTKSN